MAKLNIDEKQARQFYPGAVPELKALFEETFGKETFIPKSYEHISSFEVVCKEAGVKPEDIFNDSDAPHIAAGKRLELAFYVINGDPFFPNWDDENQYKWVGWFYMDDPGFRLHDVFYDFSYSIVGSRLCTSTEERYRHIYQYFFEDLKTHFTYKPTLKDGKFN